MQALDFIAPGPGCWELEAAHHSRPLTSFVRDLVPDAMAEGFSEGTALYGLTLSHLRSAFVNGFWYCKKVYAGVSDDVEAPLLANLFEQPQFKERMAACSRAFNGRAWLQDLKVWDEQVKPDSISRNKKLQVVDVGRLDDAALAAQIQHCAFNLREMIRRHHRFTPSAMVPIGHFLANADEWTGVDASELMVLLRGASPISKGPVRELAALATEIKKARLRQDIFEIHRADEVINELRSINAGVSKALERYLDIVGNSIVSGYDISSPAGIEVPNVLMGAIQAALKHTLSAGEQDPCEGLAAAFIDNVPSCHREDFKLMLDDARTVFRLREERTVYTDQWALGIARRSILEAGQRLAQRGELVDAEELIDASHDEIIQLLIGKGGPASEELRMRAQYRLSHSVEDAPAWLGVAPSPPVPFDAVPEAGRPGAIAMAIAMREIFDHYDAKPLAHTLTGFAASAGIYVGPVRLIDNEHDFARLRPGDVIVTRAASAAFSIVMPMVGALVTDRGGRLSHPAIIAREYGIPGVVGTGRATSLFHDDDVVRVDGAAGTVEKIG